MSRQIIAIGFLALVVAVCVAYGVFCVREIARKRRNLACGHPKTCKLSTGQCARCLWRKFYGKP